MAKMTSLARTIELENNLDLIRDAHELTAKELAEERAALRLELEKRSWLEESARKIAARVPISVFALGDLASA